jgi:hypothetical protein
VNFSFIDTHSTASIAEGAVELAGVSSGASWLVLELIGRRPRAEEDAHFETMRSEIVEGAPCYELVTRDPPGNTTLWVDQRTHWARRKLWETLLQPQDGGSPYPLAITTVFEAPIVNASIDPSRFLNIER